MAPSLSQLRAAGILRDAQEALSAREFARRMWPDAFKRWGRSDIQGTGITRRAGAFLREMVDDGLATQEMGLGGYIYRYKRDPDQLALTGGDNGA